jgi:hypothetical protein
MAAGHLHPQTHFKTQRAAGAQKNLHIALAI